MSKTNLMVVFALFATSIIATSANAHPKLTSATPPADLSTLSSPTEIRLTFSEGVIPKFSGLELKDQSGKTIATGPAATDPKDKKQLVVPLKTPLAVGGYTVNWHVVSEDTHRVRGQYSFRVEH
jgi:methionine-rich copper-binding protein CopC